MHGVNDAAICELETLRSKANGMLHPEDVVEQARSPNSALHSRFTWDDNEAAHAYRLQEARSLIRAVVRHTSTPTGLTEVRAYISLPSDRALGGYRATVEIVDDEQKLNEALRSLQRDVARLVAKYSAFAQLRPALQNLQQVAKKAAPQGASA